MFTANLFRPCPAAVVLLSTYINTLTQLGLDEQQTTEGALEENMARLRSEMESTAAEQLSESQPYTLRNLFSYLLYHSQFPHAANLLAVMLPSSCNAMSTSVCWSCGLFLFADQSGGAGGNGGAGTERE